MSRLDPWRNGLDFPKGDAADRILQANFDEQAKFNDKIGLYLVGEASVSTEQTVTSTSFIPWDGLKLSAALNGGLCVVVINAIVSTSADFVFGKLKINGETKREWAAKAVSDANSGAWIWLGNLAAGQTVFEMETRVGSGNGFLQPNNASTITTTSSLQVLEFTKG